MLTLLALWTVLGQPAGGLPLTVGPGTFGPSPGSTPVDVTLHFDAEVPEAFEIVRLGRPPGGSAWQVADVVRATPRHRAAIVQGVAGLETLLLIRAPGRPGYLLEGPFRWPARPADQTVRTTWRRTVRGAWPAAGSGPPVWIAGADEPPRDAWPRCSRLSDYEWECAGVPLGVPGAVVTHGPALMYALAPGTLSPAGVEVVSSAATAWGRLLVIGRTDRVPIARADAITVAARHATVPRMRPRSLRLDASADERIAARPVGEGVFWIAGSEAPDGTWIEIGGRGRAPIRIPAPAAAAGPVDLPLRVDLDPAASIAGRVVADDGRAAAGAIVLLSRVLPREPARDPSAPPRRMALAETTSDREGHFRFEDLGREAHEVVALHATLGRAERRVEPDETDLDVRLKRPSIVTGLVMQDGMPAAGIVVRVVPDLAEVAASEDLTELLTAPAKTDTNGRFSVAVPPRGSSEVRVEPEGSGFRRFPLGPAEALPPVIDLGTIALQAAIVVRLVLEEADGCELMASGPVGKSGVTVVRSERIGPSMFEVRVPEPGQWVIGVRCGTQTRRVQPVLFDAGGTGPLTVPLMWRQ